ncbi:MAG: hypothetical protein HKN92_06705, partial [Chitinophagales bacterium]|nr:hypothetical protein [Chitinophagales bacterium]
MQCIDYIKLSAKTTLLSLVLLSCTGEHSENLQSNTPTLICDTELRNLIEEEQQIFENQYPESILNVIYLDKINLQNLIKYPALHGIISYDMDDSAKLYIRNDRKLEIDSTAFVFQKKMKTSKYLLYKFYEFDPVNGPVKQFASFICGPQGQLIAK